MTASAPKACASRALVSKVHSPRGTITRLLSPNLLLVVDHHKAIVSKLAALCRQVVTQQRIIRRGKYYCHGRIVLRFHGRMRSKQGIVCKQRCWCCTRIKLNVHCHLGNDSVHRQYMTPTNSQHRHNTVNRVHHGSSLRDKTSN
jgi:hypothetical protein